MRQLNSDFVAIADDHKLFRFSIINYIETNCDKKVICEAENGREFLLKLEDAKELPALCIIDLDMPELNGYETLCELKAKWPDMHVLILSAFDNESAVINAFKKGANGFLSKSAHPSELCKAISDILEFGYYQSGYNTGRIFHQIIHKKEIGLSLTDDEFRFLSYCCSELTYKEIASTMQITPRTAEAYRHTLFDKLQVKSRVGLAIYALQMGLISLNK